jgi:hypothetical protein
VGRARALRAFRRAMAFAWIFVRAASIAVRAVPRARRARRARTGPVTRADAPRPRARAAVDASTSRSIRRIAADAGARARRDSNVWPALAHARTGARAAMARASTR